MRMRISLMEWIPRLLVFCTLAACLFFPASGLAQPDPVQMSLQSGESALEEYHLVEAEQYFTAARLEIERSSGADPRLVDCLSGLARVYRGFSCFALADELQTRAVTSVEKRCGVEDRALVKPLALLASIARDRRQFARADALLNRVIAIHAKLNGGENEGFAMALLSLADDYYEQGEYLWSEQMYRRGITVLIKATSVNYGQLPLYFNNHAAAYSYVFTDHGEEHIYEQGLDAHHRIVGAENSDCITTLSNLAYAYDNSKRFRDAEEVLRRAIALQAKVGDGDGRAPGLLDMQVRLVGLLVEQGRSEEAKAAQMHMLELAKTLDVQFHRDEFNILLNTGDELLNGDDELSARFKQALPWYEAALSLYERTYGTSNPSLILPLGQLAFTYEVLDRDEDARKCRQRILAIVKGRDAFANPKIVEELQTLANWSSRDLKSESRQGFLKEAILNAQTQFPDNNPATAEAFNGLAQASSEIGRLDLAESLRKRAFAALQHSAMPAQPRLDQYRIQLIAYYQQHGKAVQANQMVAEWLVEIERTCKDDKPRLAQRLLEIAGLLNGNSFNEQGRKQYDRALALFEKLYAHDDPRLAEVLYLVGSARLWPQAKCEEGLVLLRRYVAIQETSLLPNHPELIQIYQGMANLTQQVDRWEEEITWRRKALAVAESYYGEKDLRITQYLIELANRYRDHERDADAIPLLERAVAIHEQAFGPEHPGACETLNNLGNACLQTGRFFDAEVYLQHGLYLAGKECPHDEVYNGLEESLKQLRKRQHPEENVTPESSEESSRRVPAGYHISRGG